MVNHKAFIHALKLRAKAQESLYVSAWNMVLSLAWPRDADTASEDPDWLYVPCLAYTGRGMYRDLAPMVSMLERMGALERHPRNVTLVRYRRTFSGLMP